MNASGVHCMTTEVIWRSLAASEAGSFVTKSATLAPREGNPEPRYVDLALGSINSMGLPNKGLGLLSGLCYRKARSNGT
jgi:dihydroorotate dehydrogenase (fumarate)